MKSILSFSVVFLLVIASGCGNESAPPANATAEGHDHPHPHPHPHDHGHDHDHGHSHGHDHPDTPHHGIPVAFMSADTPAGIAELKLHDDKGDLELWLTTDELAQTPFDLPIDSTVTVTFPQLEGKTVTLQKRNATTNEDEDGVANLRDGQTNYFIFPGETGADASFLLGKEFSSEAVISFSAPDGVEYTTKPFVLKPHTH